MKCKGLISILIVIIMLTGSFSNAQHVIFKNYTVEDGLVSNPVRRIFQDSKGFMWIATLEGLSKYDGHQFTNYNTANGLSHNMVNDIYESADGKLYVAENNGSTDILERDAIVKKGAFPDVVINKFNIVSDHRVIAATDRDGLQEIKNGNLLKSRQAFPSSTYLDLSELNDSLLIGGGYESLHILSRRLELISEIKQHIGFEIHKIFRDSKNRVWVGTNAGLWIVTVRQNNDQSLNFIVAPAPFDIPVLKSSVINDMMEDFDGDLWICTSHGLLKIQPDGKWQLLLEKEGLNSAFISCIYQDKEKNIWVGTILGLAKLVTKTSVRIYTNEEGFAAKGMRILFPLTNDLFVTSSESGLQLFDTRKKLFSPVSSQHNFPYRDFVKNTRPVLFYTDNKSFGKYDSVHRVIVDSILPGPPIRSIFCSVMDSNGIIFNGTVDGLVVRFKNKSNIEPQLLYQIRILHIDKKGYLWVGTWDKGLFRIQYSAEKDKVEMIVKDFSQLLPDKNIRSLFEDSKGNIWVGTRYQGVVQLSNVNNNEYTAQQFELRHGLMSNWIGVITEGTKGCVWIGSSQGIDKLIPAGNSFRVFNFSRVNNFFASINAMLPENNHSLWLTSNIGLVNIIDGETEKSMALPVFITSVQLGDTSFNYNTYQTGTKLQLKYNQNQAAFGFSAPGFINEKQVYYSSRLLGSEDTTWSKASTLHNVSYASLQPGHYRFEVRTIGWNEEWGTPANFEFIIEPPYWRTWWFYSLIGLVMLLLFYGFYLYRIRQLLKLQKVRNSIASDLHDDIGATLTNINMLSEISRKNLEQPREAEKFLQRITEEVTASSQALNDIIWSVNSRNDSIEEMLSRMRRYAAELFDNSNTICHLDLDKTIAGKKINMEQRRDVYLMYKESMNNIVKHASASNVWINVQCVNGKLRLEIKDDGRGFNPVVVTNRNGLKNIRSRAEKWKGSASAKTTPGNGTFIEIIIPLAG